MRNNALVIIRFLDIHRKCIVIGHRRNDLEQVESIRAYDDLIGMADVLLEFMRIQNDVDQDGMSLIEIDDFQAVFCIRNCGVGQNILDRRNHITNRLNLHRFNGQDIILFVHVSRFLKYKRTEFLYFIFEYIVLCALLNGDLIYAIFERVCAIVWISENVYFLLFLARKMILYMRLHFFDIDYYTTRSMI